MKTSRRVIDVSRRWRNAEARSDAIVAHYRPHYRRRRLVSAQSPLGIIKGFRLGERAKAHEYETR